ncbi:sigma factor-like helix-turn-helix DNA-binding protein [Paenibacillus sp. A14]|uniref:sigma factor-like helix-turn-helix DNA-binding protein n=1 Tax=Paenibacillus sp. A14 TaxID=3119820 RepID=UPI002FE4191C
MELDALPEFSSWNSDEPSGKVLTKLLSLPEKYKTVLYLYYIEEYSVKEISEMLGHKESTIQTQKEKMFQNILTQSQNENTRRRGLPPMKHVRSAVLAAVLMVCLTTTAFAAAYLGIDETFLKFLNPVNHEQAEYLSNGAYVVDKQVANEKGTLTIKQVIGDSNLTYILMDFTAPKGTVLNAARYRFMVDTMTTDQDTQSYGFEVVDDGNPIDNKVSLVMRIMTKNSIAGQTVHFKLKDLQAADPLPGVFETVIPGSWETSFKLDFKEYSTLYQIDQNITMFGYRAVLKTISVSPISISLKIEGKSLKEIDEAAGRLRKSDVNEFKYLDNYPITINYKDGTAETTSIFTGWTLTEFGVQMLTIKTFENVINDKEIASIVFFNKEIPINN